MPLVRHKNKTFLLRWKPEWDIKILVCALKFRYGQIRRDQPVRPCVNWTEAEARGYLRGLPDVSHQNLSHRVSYLCYTKHDPIGFRKKRAYNKAHPYLGHLRRTLRNKTDVFQKDVPENDRRRFGHKPREKWTEEQRKVLLWLAKKYRKSPITIDWKNLIKDDTARVLPEQALCKIRSYYWRYIRKDVPEIKKQHRKSALDYKYKHYKKYRQNQKRAKSIIKNSVNNFLYSKLGLK